MKKWILFILLFAFAGGGYYGWKLFLAPTTRFTASETHIYLPTMGADRETILRILQEDSVVSRIEAFDWMAKKLEYWENIKPGRYKIEKEFSVFKIIKLLRSGQQSPTRLVINRLRLPSDFAKVISRSIESDTAVIMAFLNNKEKMKELGFNETNWPAMIIPNTYELLWTWEPEKVLEKLKTERDKWWAQDSREEKAAALGLTPFEVHIVASIVEEETNKKQDKPLVASVYLNRIKKGMPLQADPTVRFARKDFKSNRVLYTHLRTPSPYNTYLNRGLPPGPICTATPQTLEAVLEAPKTDYIFFVANADLMGGSTFTKNLSDHNKAARLYQDSLSTWLKRKAIKERAILDSIAAGKETVLK
jgi:UPF0755 protein